MAAVRKKIQFPRFPLAKCLSFLLFRLCLPHSSLPFFTFLDEGTRETLEGSTDSPESPDQLGVLQQTGVDWQPQLALCHGQLAVFE